MTDQPLPEIAQPGDLVHDLGAEQDVGWFIVGEDGYWDVDNACWEEDHEEDAPWTSEHFQLFGPIVMPPADVRSTPVEEVQP